MPNWEVVVYGAWSDEEQEDFSCGEGILACWTIENRTEQKALYEATIDVQSMGDAVADWTLMEVA